jgi:cyclopropane fatty-acyl-phospholipid synthase-like methyltransferase
LSGVGIDNNKYLIKICSVICKYLNLKNVSFEMTSFENFNPRSKFDIVLSLANHKTFDGNTKQSIYSYFEKINSFLNPDGLLIFESHPPQIENEEQLENVIKSLKIFFDIKESPKIEMKGFLDKNRTYFICSPKKFDAISCC